MLAYYTFMILNFLILIFTKLSLEAKMMFVKACTELIVFF